MEKLTDHERESVFLMAVCVRLRWCLTVVFIFKKCFRDYKCVRLSLVDRPPQDIRAETKRADLSRASGDLSPGNWSFQRPFSCVYVNILGHFVAEMWSLEGTEVAEDTDTGKKYLIGHSLAGKIG